MILKRIAHQVVGIRIYNRILVKLLETVEVKKTSKSFKTLAALTILGLTTLSAGGIYIYNTQQSQQSLAFSGFKQVAAPSFLSERLGDPSWGDKVRVPEYWVTVYEHVHFQGT